jgi:hypothetical protein
MFRYEQVVRRYVSPYEFPEVNQLLFLHELQTQVIVLKVDPDPYRISAENLLSTFEFIPSSNFQFAILNFQFSLRCCGIEEFYAIDSICLSDEQTILFQQTNRFFQIHHSVG